MLGYGSVNNHYKTFHSHYNENEDNFESLKHAKSNYNAEPQVIVIQDLD